METSLGVRSAEADGQNRRAYANRPALVPPYFPVIRGGRGDLSNSPIEPAHSGLVERSETEEIMKIIIMTLTLCIVIALILYVLYTLWVFRSMETLDPQTKDEKDE